MKGVLKGFGHIKNNKSQEGDEKVWVNMRFDEMQDERWWDGFLGKERKLETVRMGGTLILDLDIKFIPYRLIDWIDCYTFEAYKSR